MDLDGDGATNENYCQWAASLTVPPGGGPAFGLVKSVQGNLDSAPKYSPGIGYASPGGSGTYALTWTNTGGKNLTNPVVYDVPPYVGDTGASLGQAGVARGSQFASAASDASYNGPQALGAEGAEPVLASSHVLARRSANAGRARGRRASSSLSPEATTGIEPV